jgi:monovalent cation/hydrogen antiporter
MGIFELVIGLLFMGGLLALWANRVGVPYPALLALVGAVLALVPGTPSVALDPELALALFVAPTLLDAAYDASPRDLRRNVVPVLSLSVGMVLMTVFVIACVMRVVVPDMGWAAAIALGAIVAPPDASAASAVLRKLRPPHRLLVILEGESLFNDATSLLVYRAAVGAAVTGVFSGWGVLPTLLLTCGGGVIVGYVLARVQIWLSSHIEEIPINVLLQFVATFGVWIFAEYIGLSAIITLVTFAMTLARRLGGRMNARHQMASYAVWDVAVLVLNVLAFVLIGLQLRGIVSRIDANDWSLYALSAAVVVAAVVVVRIAWIMAHTSIDRWYLRRRDDVLHSAPTFRAAMLSSWCGMRGIVTLAAALALPVSTGLPHRDLIVFCAFAVVLSTLVVQGLTLPPLMRRLGLGDDGTVEREIRLARAEAARAALTVLEQEAPQSASAQVLVAEYRSRAEQANASPVNDSEDEATLAELQRRTVSAQREALLRLRANHEIGDDAFHAVAEEVALLELAGETRSLPPAITS